MKKRKVWQAIYIVLFWIFGTNFLTLFSIYSIRGYLYYAKIDPDDIQFQMAEYWLSPSQFIEAFLFGTFFGLLFVVINDLSDRFHWDRWSFSKVILTKSLLYLAGFLVIFVIVYLFIDALGFYSPDVWDTTIHSGWLPMLLLIGLFMLFNIILLNYLIEANKKIGNFNLLSFLTGKYREPVVENRIFMFVDLKSSTTLAEQLGSVKYSQLIRDCFLDLNMAVRKHLVEIYQYVGDEAVITAEWKGRSAEQMIDLFFDFRYRLKRRQAYYEKKYQCMPVFKAGIHGGEVTTTEVGTIRRHIAFHGDVMNTTSRIQHLCNRLGEELLASEELFDQKLEKGPYVRKVMGTFELTGKKQSVSLVAIRQQIV